MTACKAAGCDQPAAQGRRGYCSPHYYKDLQYGDPLVEVHARPNPGAICKVEECDRKIVAKGLCGKHYQRMKATGDPLGSNPRKRKEEIGYSGAHWRLSKDLGRAADYPCAGEGCNEVGAEWAYDGKDPSELRNEAGLRYSLDPNRYIPLCKRCHIRFDLDPNAPWLWRPGEDHPGAKLTKEGVAHIRANPDVPATELAAELGVSTGAVHAVRHNKSWKTA